jgi:hypothetical protein
MGYRGQRDRGQNDRGQSNRGQNDQGTNWLGDKVTGGESDRGQSDRGTKLPWTKWPGDILTRTKWLGTNWPGRKCRVTGQNRAKPVGCTSVYIYVRTYIFISPQLQINLINSLTLHFRIILKRQNKRQNVFEFEKYQLFNASMWQK